MMQRMTYNCASFMWSFDDYRYVDCISIGLLIATCLGWAASNGWTGYSWPEIFSVLRTPQMSAMCTTRQVNFQEMKKLTRGRNS